MARHFLGPHRAVAGCPTLRREVAAIRSGDVEAPDNYEDHQEEKKTQGGLVLVVFAV